MSRQFPGGLANYLSSTAFSLPTEDISISFWINENGDNINYIFSTASVLFYIHLAEDKILAVRTNRTGGTLTLTNPMTNYNINSWNHIVITSEEGSYTKVYHNGSEASYSAQPVQTGDFVTNTRIEIGRDNIDITSDFVGHLAEFGIWNRILTAEEIANLSNSNGAYSPILIPDGLLECWRMCEDETDVPDYGADFDLTINGTVTTSSHPPNIITRIEDFSAPQLLSSSDPTFDRGKIIAQTTTLSEPKEISKASLYLNPYAASEYILEEDGVASFSALNFQFASDPHAWTICTETLSTYNASDDMSVDQGFLTNAGAVSYSMGDEVYLTSPFVRYDVHLSPGTYNIYCRYCGSGSFWYAWDKDQVPDEVTVTTGLMWHKIGDFHVEETGVHHLRVYLGTAGAEDLRIDQFYMIEINSGISDLNIEGEHITKPLSSCPYNTFVRIREAPSTGINNLTSSQSKGWGWKSSNEIKEPGWHNYDINDISISEGLSLEYLVISGDADHQAQWNFTPSDETSRTYTSDDYGQIFTQD